MVPPRVPFFLLPTLAVLAVPVLAAPASAPAAEARAIDTELVACGTRHSMSSWTDPRRGIGCARDAVVRRLNEIAAIAEKTGGHLRVVVDKYETTGPRTGNAAVPMENVYAILEGTDPARKKTAYVVSGHLGDEGEVHVLDQVAVPDPLLDPHVLVLVVVVLQRLGDADRRQPPLHERQVIAAAAEAVAPEDQPHA